MANWYGYARSNYVKVKNVAEAISDLECFDIEVDVHPTLENYIALFGSSDNGGFQFTACTYEDEDAEESGLEALEIELDIAEWCKNNLCEGQVLVLVEVGAEKLRYLTGWSSAYTWDGRHLTVSLDSTLRKLIAEQWGFDPETIAPPTYTETSEGVKPLKAE